MQEILLQCETHFVGESRFFVCLGVCLSFVCLGFFCIFFSGNNLNCKQNCFRDKKKNMTEHLNRACPIGQNWVLIEKKKKVFPRSFTDFIELTKTVVNYSLGFSKSWHSFSKRDHPQNCLPCVQASIGVFSTLYFHLLKMFQFSI